MLLRKDPETLTQSERSLFQAVFPGDAIEYIRTDPSDYIDHATKCAELKPDAVLLPMERPIPSKAMEEGVPHVALSPNGLLELKPLVPSFQKFVPK